MEPEASITLPSVSSTLNRNVYYYKGNEIEIDDTVIPSSNRVKLAGDQEIIIHNGSEVSQLLVFEGKPDSRTDCSIWSICDEYTR